MDFKTIVNYSFKNFNFKLNREVNFSGGYQLLGLSIIQNKDDKK